MLHLCLRLWRTCNRAMACLWPNSRSTSCCHHGLLLWWLLLLWCHGCWRGCGCITAWAYAGHMVANGTLDRLSSILVHQRHATASTHHVGDLVALLSTSDSATHQALHLASSPWVHEDDSAVLVLAADLGHLIPSLQRHRRNMVATRASNVGSTLWIHEQRLTPATYYLT